MTFQPEGPDVGKLKFEQTENDQKSRRRSVGKLNNPFEVGLETQSKTQKQRARRASKVTLTFIIIKSENSHFYFVYCFNLHCIQFPIFPIYDFCFSYDLTVSWSK